jgi:hypothetical protein
MYRMRYYIVNRIRYKSFKILQPRNFSRLAVAHHACQKSAGERAAHLKSQKSEAAGIDGRKKARAGRAGGGGWGLELVVYARIFHDLIGGVSRSAVSGDSNRTGFTCPNLMRRAILADELVSVISKLGDY